jgi:hypothetical protein
MHDGPVHDRAEFLDAQAERVAHALCGMTESQDGDESGVREKGVVCLASGQLAGVYKWRKLEVRLVVDNSACMNDHSSD